MRSKFTDNEIVDIPDVLAELRKLEVVQIMGLCDFMWSHLQRILLPKNSHLIVDVVENLMFVIVT
jgi:hypothetical protein